MHITKVRWGPHRYYRQHSMFIWLKKHKNQWMFVYLRWFFSLYLDPILFSCHSPECAWEKTFLKCRNLDNFKSKNNILKQLYTSQSEEKWFIVYMTLLSFQKFSISELKLWTVKSLCFRVPVSASFSLSLSQYVGR